MKGPMISLLILVAGGGAVADHGSAVAECSRLGNPSQRTQCIELVTNSEYPVSPRAVRACVGLRTPYYALACVTSVSLATRPVNGADIEACTRLGNMHNVMTCVNAVTGT